jgi:hypothetical protein
MPLGGVNPDLHSRFRILLAIICAIFPVATVFALLAVLSAASNRKNAAGREQGDNA